MIQNILQLPVEIGTLIFTYLDIKSKIYAYTIIELRQFFAPSLMRKVNISRSTFAASKTLCLDALQDYAENIQELNLSTIQDLTAEKLFPYLQKCTNLKTLDVTFTRIFLPDVEHICCDSLKNISINYFKWPRKDEVWKKCSDIFKRQRFERVHFVISDLYNSESPLTFMEDIPMTKDLKITFALTWDYSEVEEDQLSIDNNDDTLSIDIHFEHLCYIFCECAVSQFDTYRRLEGLLFLDYNKIEYIFMMMDDDSTPKIYVSPIFSPMFGLNCANLTINITICSRLPLYLDFKGNMIFNAWNTEVTVFDDEFFSNVKSELTDYFPIYICMDTMEPLIITEAPSHWYCIDTCDTFNELLDHLPENVTLTSCCRRGSVLTYNYNTVPYPELNSMKNITFLSMGIERMGDDFFTFLFLQCKKLYTLNVEGSNPDLALYLLNSVHLTKSLKNLKIALENMDYAKVFFSICQCSSLENVHIYEYQEDQLAEIHNADEQIIMSLIEKCYNLYSLFIRCNMTKDGVIMLMGALRTAAQRMGRDHLCIQVYCHACGWNPFQDVFSPSPLQIDRS